MVLGREICYNDYNNKLAGWCMVLTSRTEEEFNRTGSKIKISRKRKQNE
jgi:hypothetical protein